MKNGDCTGYCMSCTKKCIIWNPKKVSKALIPSYRLKQLGEGMRIFKCVDDGNRFEVIAFFRKCFTEEMSGFFTYSTERRRFEHISFNPIVMPRDKFENLFGKYKMDFFYLSNDKFNELIDERCVYYAERKIDQWNK